MSLLLLEILPGVHHPVYRLAIIVSTLVVAPLLYIQAVQARIGMLIRAEVVE